MERWHVPSIGATGKREPRVLLSRPACRAVVVDLAAGESMGEHSVRETLLVQVVSGRVAIATGEHQAACEPGTLAVFEPGERHSVDALEASRLLLLLAPWPGSGHYQPGEEADPDRLPPNARSAPIPDPG